MKLVAEAAAEQNLTLAHSSSSGKLSRKSSKRRLKDLDDGFGANDSDWDVYKVPVRLFGSTILF